MKWWRLGIWSLLGKEERDWQLEKFLEILRENVELLRRAADVRRQEEDWCWWSLEERNLTWKEVYCLGNLMRIAQWGWLNIVDREDRDDAIFGWVGEWCLCCGWTSTAWIGLRMATTKPASWVRRLWLCKKSKPLIYIPSNGEKWQKWSLTFGVMFKITSKLYLWLVSVL